MTLLGLAAGTGSVACSEQVSLGAWASGGGAAGGGAGNSGAAGGGAASGGAAGAAAAPCVREGTPGGRNAAGTGTNVEVTVTYTDWTWPSASDSIEWDFKLEKAPVKDGYFWAHGFDLAGSVSGFVGLQYRGGYQADPPDGLVQTANMLVFWISGAPIRAELGDVAYPNARKYFKTDGEWWTIHVLYDWEVCRLYRLRMGRQGSEANGDIWYGAWVRDTVTNVETYLGRILVPLAWGQLAATSSMWSNRVIGQGATCADIEPVSAIFGFPTANAGGVLPLSHVNSFARPASCGSSRFTEFPDAVRQELGVAP